MANEKFDSIVDRALVEDLKRRERKLIEDIELILQAFADEDEDDDEYAVDEPEDAGDWYGEDEFDNDDDWLEEESEE